MAVAAGALDSIPVDPRNYADLTSDGDDSTDIGAKTTKLKQKVPSIDAKDGGTLTRSSVRDHERKIGHRRVDHDGVVTYKKKPTSELMTAIQLGIGQSVGGLSSKPERDVLMQDFAVVESVFYPREGSNLTPAHHCSDFRFKTYAPIAFRYFRELFDIQPDDFMLSLCHDPLRELSNPGASGSIFYITDDDEFIIKTLQHKEADFLQKLLPGYFLNISQNSRTLLPKFYGLYCYQCGGKNIRFIVMNNLLPSTIAIHEKYDLKGSTYKRKASKRERLKSNPTYKDLDFQEFHPEGILLEKEIHDGLIKTLQRDCRVLESFKIMDYSLLVGIHNLDKSLIERSHSRVRSVSDTVQVTTLDTAISPTESYSSATPNAKTMALQRGKSFKTRLATGTTPLEAIRADVEDYSEDMEDVPPGGIPARNSRGERMYLYLGIIDILQSYRLKKKLEHSIKSIVTDGDTISVHRPSYYANRYLAFFSTRVFRKVPTPLKHSPSKKKGQVSRARTQSTITEQTEPSNSDKRVPEKTQRTISFSDECNPSLSSKPDLVPVQTKSSTKCTPPNNQNLSNTGKTEELRKQAVSPNFDGGGDKRSDVMTTTCQSDEAVTTRFIPTIRSSPPLSLSESTPTHTDYTEGTPSFTTSSPSCSSDVLDSNLNSDHVQYSVSFVPEQLSPSKKASSSTEVSYSSALESPKCTENLQEAPSLTMDADETLIVSTPQVPTPHVMHVHESGQHALAVIGGGRHTNRDSLVTKGSNSHRSLIVGGGNANLLNKGHNSMSVGTGVVNYKAYGIREIKSSHDLSNAIINKNKSQINGTHSDDDDFEEILSKVDFDDDRHTEKPVKHRGSRRKLKTVSTGALDKISGPDGGTWVKPSFVHMSLPGSDRLFGHMMTANANVSDDPLEIAEVDESTDL